MAWICTLALVYTSMVCVQAYGSGAPSGVCRTMMPGHGASPQTDLSPYHFTVSPKENNEYEIVIEAQPGDFFRGFMIQPRQESDRNQIIRGEFAETADSKVVDCDDGNNFLTHKDKSDKTKIVAYWRPSANVEGSIVIRSTLLRTAKVFWTNVDTEVLSISKREDFIGSTPDTTSTKHATPQPSGQGSDSSIGCGVDRSCFSMPDNSALLTYVFDVSANAVEFEITAAAGSSTNMWISAGLSENELMGDDSVADCILSNGQPSFHYSWNQRRSNAIEKVPSGIEMLNSSFTDGILKCKWKRSTQTSEKGIKFDLINETYYILLAKGTLESRSPLVKSQHTERLATSKRMNLTSISIVPVSSDAAVLVKVHGCLMVIAWVGLVSIGILLARHYKDVWEEKTLCNVKIWFAFHRGLMLTSVVMVLIAFIIIFVHVGEWSSSATAHAVFGCISTVLAVLQPLGALCRPDPKHPKRPIFNWAHWSGGNVAQIAAFIAIFLAVEVPAAYLPSAFTWVFAIFIAYHCLFHLLFQVYIWQVEKKKSNEINMIELSGDKKNEAKIPGEKFKKTMLAIYSFPVAGLVVTLLFIIGL